MLADQWTAQESQATKVFLPSVHAKAKSVYSKHTLGLWVATKEGSECCCTRMQIDADYVATWYRMLATFPYAGGGVVYDGATRLTLPPDRDGTG